MRCRMNEDRRSLIRAAILVCAVVVSAGSGVVRAQRSARTRPAKPPRPTGPAAAWISDEHVGRAIRRGLDFLYKTQSPEGTWETKYDRGHEGGCEALVLVAALSAGEDRQNPQLKIALAHLDKLTPETVYVRAMRTMVYSRLRGEAYKKRLAGDVAWLVKRQSRNGGWGYGPGHRTTRVRPDWTDASNSQLALLALRDAADAGVEISDGVWRRVRDYWANAQNSDGGWGYEPPGRSVARLRGSSHGSMTAAGLASMLISIDKYGLSPASEDATVSPDVAILSRGFGWLAKNFTVTKVPGWVWGTSEEWPYYYLWCLARVCSRGGLRSLGTHQWYPEMAARVLSRQRRDGSWSNAPRGEKATDAPVRTCFALLTLIQGRAPVLINELGGRVGFGGSARATRWIGGRYGKPTAWQAIRPDDSDEVFSEAPILYINLGGRLKLADLPADRIRRFVREGGTVLVGTPIAGVGGARDGFLTMFSKYGYHAEAVGQAHPLMTVVDKLSTATGAQLVGIGDHCRTRIFIMGSDKGLWRSTPGAGESPGEYKLAINLLYYTTDRTRPKRRVPASARRKAAKADPLHSLRVSRIRHAGGWADCPMAMTRLSEVLTEALSLGVKEVQPVSLSGKIPPGVSLLWMTGSADPKLTDQQKARLKKFVEGGGTLFVDSTVGKIGFVQAVSAMLKEMFGPDNLETMLEDHPIITGRFGGGIGSDIRKVHYTRAAAGVHPDKRIAGLVGVEINGRTAVIFSRYGVTCPLEGLPTYGCVGLATDDARRLAANVVLYTIVRP